MRSFTFTLFMAMLQLLVFSGVYAQNASLVAVVEQDGAFMIKVSDNGQWAAGYVSDPPSYKNASVWNLETYERIQLVPNGQSAAAFDVTDNGEMAVGCYDDQPAYWQNGAWTMLPMPVENGIGEVHSVTPDGTKMAGRVFASNWTAGYACVWENGQLVEVNHAAVDRTGSNAYFNEMVAVSADGNTMLGCLNYVVLPNRTAFLMKNGEYFMFGAHNYDPLQGGSPYNFYDVLSMSSDGKYVTGDIYWVEEVWVSEYFCPFRYDVENDVTELFLDDIEVASFAVDNAGNLYGATPLNYPLRDALILKDGEWVSLDQEILETYGLDVQDETGYDKLSNVFSVSADGRTIVGVNGIHTNNWVLKLPEVVGNNETPHAQGDMKAIVKGGYLLMEGKIAHMSIVDIKGTVMMDTNIRMPIVSVADYSTGVYIVRMTDIDGFTKSQKVFIGF